MKTLMILSAIPASGKSTWASKYQATHHNVYIISSDAIRMELTGGNYGDQSKQKDVWRVFSERIHEFGKIDDVTVILDALNDLNVLREKYVKENPEFDKYILVQFQFNPERSKEFNHRRPPQVAVPDHIMDMLIDKFEQPTEEIKDLFDEIWEIRWREK
ncbi:MAG: ATP-binding protein [Bacilli bacterium]|nr:ATP-binding protein [Bacilli bacterium]